MANIDFGAGFETARRSEARQARLMLLVVYPPCLVAAVISRLVGTSISSRSVFAEARASAAACIAFAFR